MKAHLSVLLTHSSCPHGKMGLSLASEAGDLEPPCLAVVT